MDKQASQILAKQAKFQLEARNAVRLRMPGHRMDGWEAQVMPHDIDWWNGPAKVWAILQDGSWMIVDVANLEPLDE